MKKRMGRGTSKGKTRKGIKHMKRGGSRRNHKGGNVMGGIISALKTALPSIVLYEALRVQNKRVNRKGTRGKGTRKSKRR